MSWASSFSCLRPLGGLGARSVPGAAGVRGALCAAFNLRACLGTPVLDALGDVGEMLQQLWTVSVSTTF